MRRIPLLPSWLYDLADQASAEIRRPWASAWPLTFEGCRAAAHELGYVVRLVPGLRGGAATGRILIVPDSPNPLLVCPALIHELAESLIRSGKVEAPQGAGSETAHLVACLVEDEYRRVLEGYLYLLDQADRHRAELRRLRSQPPPPLSYERDEWCDPVMARRAGRRRSCR